VRCNSSVDELRLQLACVRLSTSVLNAPLSEQDAWCNPLWVSIAGAPGVFELVSIQQPQQNSSAVYHMTLAAAASLTACTLA
jgi:hypothetical protein